MRFAGALVVVGLVVAQASLAHAFVPPTYQGGTLRGYTLLLGSYRLVEVAGTSMPAGSPFDVRIVLTATTLEISIGTSQAEKATYRVTDHYGDIYRLEITGIKDKKVEVLEVMLHGDILTVYELDTDGHDKNKMRFERIPP